ncbi:hypothetical protein AVENLUH5627_01752 [Acinetobacter venetianus]|uniref:Uncharacterized protein n=1 Tax=Acinetobacter venetianus TaxID=52133 RepID=A0A150HPX5_9GAMM|nr:PilC/PilY family type IV pilus protein [Acinetobacter venetianus]KXZ68645.1 hypothetical protein AVENLUH5627_01752 [Acinetobacter venetianus]
MKKLISNASVKYGVSGLKLSPLAVACGVFVGSILTLSSVAQATDLQIYAKPDAGQKTIVLMLDTSGSMAEYDNDSCIYYYYNRAYYYGTGTESATTAVPYERSYCKNSSGVKVAYSRLTRLKDGMFALLDNTTNPNLPSASIGLGNFSAAGDGRSGQILVPAAKLGVVGSNQRNLLKGEIAKLVADAGTPSAHAYAEAAAYMLGTSTTAPVEIQKDFYKKANEVSLSCPSGYSLQNNGWCYRYWNNWIEPTKTITTKYYYCDSYSNTNFDNKVQYCKSSGWKPLGSVPSDLTKDGNYSSGNDTIYYVNEMQTGANLDSGFAQSVSSSKNANQTAYASPLPTKKVSCDGNGIYFLSDGEANSSSTDRAQSLMRTALNDNSFTCPTNGLTNLTYGRSGESAWHCMGELAKRLYSGNNPQKAEIRTAFVGFGSDFSGLSAPHVQQACQLSSRTQDDRKGDDACSPTQATQYRVAKPGYGNGLYYEASDSKQVEESVLEFLRTFDNPLDPLPTGAISVPVDTLNPNGFQPYGYLRTFAPNPKSNTMVWLGNLKKYNISKIGALADRFNNLVFDAKGGFSTTTSDLWNETGVADGKVIDQGGAYWNLPMPTQQVAAIPAIGDKRAVPAILAAPEALRKLFTDVTSVSGGVLQSSTKGSLLAIPDRTSSNVVTNGEYVLERFNKQNILMDFPIDLKVKLLNYLGYDLPLSTTTVLPSLLPVPSKPFITLGGSIHSFPVQLTYSGELDANGDLTTVRKQSVLFGSMEGGLHVLDAKQGVEQMVFVPSDILKDPSASKSLRGVDQAGNLTHGVSGAWVADPAYKFSKGSGSATSSVDARQMNVYGGMRMGGSSFYGLDLLNPTSPKLLFRVGPDLGGKYSRMGQSWSKPVLANVRYNGVITRVVIVGGGYDMCYENPRFKLGQSNPAEYGGGCNKSQAMGNAVYMLDANTGSVLWWASNSGADNNNPNMTHSIVSRISTLDRDADGLVDHLYFGDLGGQVFRADFNNKSTATKFGVRVVRMANLGSTTVSSGDQPRFYQPPTLTIHDVGVNTFIVVGIASGDRSTPLDVSPSIGRETMLPSTALSGRPTNKVYGLIDRDFINKSLMSIADSDLKTKDIVLSNLVENPQTLSMSNLTDKLSPSSGSATNQGWYRSLSSDYAGNKVAGRTDGGVKAFEEEPIAIKNNLFIPVYDPEGTGLDPVDSCSTRIIGESNRQQYCLPFGKCETTALEEKTGFRISGGKNQNVIGSGIRGITLGPGSPSGTGGPGGPSGNGPKNSCGNLTLVGNITGSGEWQCSRLLNPIRWYERYVTAKTK